MWIVPRQPRQRDMPLVIQKTMMDLREMGLRLLYPYRGNPCQTVRTMNVEMTGERQARPGHLHNRQTQRPAFMATHTRLH